MPEPSPKPAAEQTDPMPWVSRWLPPAGAGLRLLDFACGRGRHSIYARTLGYTVDAADRNAQALAVLPDDIRRLEVDLEAGAWPFERGVYDVVVVTNYLFRPRLDFLAGLLAPGGRLIYATFADGNEKYGKPSNPDFLLRSGELFQMAIRGGLQVLAFEQGTSTSPSHQPAVVQRLCAVRPVAADGHGTGTLATTIE